MDQQLLDGAINVLQPMFLREADT